MPDPKDKDGYTYIHDVSEEECMDRWKGKSWESNGDDSGLGLCQSEYDFDQ